MLEFKFSQLSEIAQFSPFSFPTDDECLHENEEDLNDHNLDKDDDDLGDDDDDNEFDRSKFGFRSPPLPSCFAPVNTCYEDDVDQDDDDGDGDDDDDDDDDGD